MTTLSSAAIACCSINSKTRKAVNTMSSTYDWDASSSTVRLATSIGVHRFRQQMQKVQANRPCNWSTSIPNGVNILSSRFVSDSSNVHSPSRTPQTPLPKDGTPMRWSSTTCRVLATAQARSRVADATSAYRFKAIYSRTYQVATCSTIR